MASTRGDQCGVCQCGCGEAVYEKIYSYDYRPGRPMIVIPTRLPGHTKPPKQRGKRVDMVPAEEVVRLVERFRAEYGFTWKELTELFGFSHNVWSIRKRKSIAKWRAEIILRTIRDYHIKHKNPIYNRA